MKLPATAPEYLRQIPVDLLHPSPFNPRQDMPRAELKELAASIASVGILQPILARQVIPQGLEPEQFEIVCGHRRVAAAKIAGLATVPAVVQEMDDGEARRRQLIENMQRKDLTPLEEAEGFQELVRGGASVEEAATATHKSVGTVYARLQLLNLPAAAVKALKSGLLPVTVATLIGRIPHEELRKQATKRLLESARRDDDPVSYSFARGVIRQEFMTDLATAPFPIVDEQLVEGVGSCTACPRRTGNAPDLFGDLAGEKRGDHICTDPKCFAQKTAAQVEHLKAQAEASGQRVLGPKELGKVFTRYDGSIRHDSPFIRPDQKCYLDPKSRSFRSLLGKDVPEAVLAIDPNGRPHHLLSRKAVEKAMSERYEWARFGRSGKASLSPAEKKRRQEAQVRSKVDEAVLAELVVAGEGQACRTPSVDQWAAVARAAIHRAWHETLKDICRRRGLVEEKPAKGKGRQARPRSPEEILLKQLVSMSGAETRGLALEVLFRPYVCGESGSSFSRTTEQQLTVKIAASAFGIDRAAAEKRVRAKVQAAKTEKPARKRSKKAAAEGEA